MKAKLLIFAKGFAYAFCMAAVLNMLGLITRPQMFNIALPSLLVVTNFVLLLKHNNKLAAEKESLAKGDKSKKGDKK